MNEEFDKIERLLQAGDFDTLSAEDQFWIKDHLGSPETFDQLREATIIARTEKELPVRSKVKQDLMRQFKEKHQPGWKLVLQWKVPAYAAVLMLMLVATTLITFMPEKERIVETFIAQEPVIDTVYVVSQPDTVFIERIVEQPVYVKVVEEAEEAPVLAVERKSKGKSLADQSDIKDILVSGR
ncbi:MAG: hypothetical protein R8G66_04975 [Cytophagales bacterium]|nr:hypothetical protein [Cytophagales bacterium]